MVVTDRQPTSLVAHGSQIIRLLALLSCCLHVRSENCWCIDVCEDDGAHRFVAHSRDVHLGRLQPGSAGWMGYFAAVYAGRVLEPFDLSRINYVYLNSPAWRTQHRGAPNPFRDCYDSVQPQCNYDRCQNKWYRALQRHPRVLPFNVSVHKERVRTRYRVLNLFPEGLPGALLFSSGVMGYGHTAHVHDNFVEIMRHDNLRWNWPGTEEGTRVSLHRAPLNVTERHLHRTRGRGSHSTTADERIQTNLTARIVGCWARPAAGSGIWVRATRVLSFEHASDPANSANNETAAGDASGLQRVHAALAWGHDGVAIQLADGKPQKRPVFVVTSAPCTTRDTGIGTCLPPPVEVRAGWHDLPCACNSSWMQLNCAGTTRY